MTSLSEASPAPKRDFVPLESNPTAINKYMQGLGCSTEHFCWAELLSCEEWAFGMVPENRLAVMLNFPITEAVRADEALERQRIAATPQLVDASMFFCNQTIGNACGTVGIIHAIGQAKQQVDLPLTGWLNAFFQECEGKSPMERADIMEHGEAADELEELHEEAAADDDNTSAVDANLNNHFITFVVGRDNHLYECDGRKEWLVNHGKSSKETLLQDACKVIQEKFFARDPNGMFAMTVLASNK